MSQPRTTPNHNGSDELLSLKDFSRVAYLGLTRLQGWAKEQTVEESQGRVLIGNVRHRVLVIDQDDLPAVVISVEITHPHGIGDLSWMAFRAASYALFTVCREKMRHDLVNDGPRRWVKRGSAESADMPIGDVHMYLSVQVLDLV